MKTRIKNCTHHDSKVVQKLAAGGMAGSRNSDKSGPAGPSKDSSGRNASSASSKGAFGGGGGGLGGGGNKSGGNAGKTNKGGGLGLTTGKTIHGNTAFGPAGGNAVGHAMSKGGTGMGPSNKSFSNFKTPTGQASFPNMGDRAVTARNAQQARGMMSALSSAQGPKRPGPKSANVVPTSAPPKARPKPKLGSMPKIPFDATLDKFKAWWNEKVTTGPVPTRPRPKPQANIWGGKANGPLGAGWDEKAPGNRKRDRSLGAGWDERVPKEDK